MQRLAYLVSHYPALSHAFIEREVQALRATGAEVHTFSVRPTPPCTPLSPESRAEQRATVVLQQRFKARPWRYGLWLLTHLPVWAPGFAGRVRRFGPRGAKARLWQVFYFLQALPLYLELRRLGVRHMHVHHANTAADIARWVVVLGTAHSRGREAWTWSLALHGPTEFLYPAQVDIAAKLESAAMVASISEYASARAREMLPPDQWPKIRIVHMTVPMERFPLVDRGGRAGRPVVLFVGRLVWEKSPELLVETVGALRDRGVDLELRIAGDGPLKATLEGRIAEAGLGERVRLLGPVDQAALPALYAAADVFCLPSLQEGVPVVLMEAMASGLPVVSTRITGIPELVESGVSGVLVEPGDADALADALQSLVADPGERIRLGAAAHDAVAADFTAGVNGARLAEALAMLDERSAARPALP